MDRKRALKLDGGLSTTTPVSCQKKAKTSSIGDLTVLSPDLWALILDNLPYKDIMSCSEASVFFLRDCLPKLSVLFIHRYQELDVRQARRFAFKAGSNCIKSVFVYSYLDFKVDRIEFEDDDETYERSRAVLCEETAMRIGPFLEFFPGLEYLFVGSERVSDPNYGTLSAFFDQPDDPCLTPTGIYHQPRIYYVFEGDDCRTDSPETAKTLYAKEREVHRSMLRSLVTLFRSYPISKNIDDLTMKGVLENSGYYLCREVACGLCGAVVDTFPPASVLLEQQLCTPMQDRLEILLRKKSGPKYLQNPDNFCHILWRHSSYGHVGDDSWFDSLESDEPYRLCPAKLSTVKSLICAGCDPAKVERADMLEFMWPWGRPLERRRIRASTFEQMVDMKFPLRSQDCVIVPDEVAHA